MLAFSSACTEENDSPNEESDPLLDPIEVRQLVLEGQVLMFLSENPTTVDPRVLPLGFELQGRHELLPSSSSWCSRLKGSPTEIKWELKGPDTYDAVFFTIFSSNGEARKAWQKGIDSLPCGVPAASVRKFEVGSTRTPTRLFPARLVNGSVPQEPPEVSAGFSSAQALLGNIIISTETLSGRAVFGANSHAAVFILERLVTFLSERLCPRINPC